jgi:hypothetical protein
MEEGPLMAIDPRTLALGREADRAHAKAEVALQEMTEAWQKLQTAIEASTEALKAFRNAVLADPDRLGVSMPERERPEGE